MAPKNEHALARGPVAKRLKEEAKRGDLWYVKMGAWKWAVGLPDYLMCVAGRFLAIELKHPSDERSQPTARQRFVLDRIRRAGGIIAVCRSADDVGEAIARARAGILAPFAFDARPAVEHADP